MIECGLLHVHFSPRTNNTEMDTLIMGFEITPATPRHSHSLILQQLLGGKHGTVMGGRRLLHNNHHQQQQQQPPPTTTASSISGERVARWLRRTAPGVECRDGLGRSALALAAMQGDAPAAEALLAAGYDPDGPDGNRLSPLSYAAWKGPVWLVRCVVLVYVLVYCACVLGG
jgi:hypothetical protein